MPINITFGSEGNESDQSSLSDDGSGVDSSGSLEEDWAHLPYPDEIAAESGHSHRSHPSRHTQSRSRSSRRYSRREVQPPREAYTQRSHRHRSPETPESDESDEEPLEEYTRHRQERRFYSPPAPVGVGYAPSASSGPHYNVFPNGGVARPPFPHDGPPLQQSDQLVRFGQPVHMGHPGQYGNTSPPYGYGAPQYPAPHPTAIPPFFGNDQFSGHPGTHPTHPSHHMRQPRNRSRGQSPPEPSLSHVPSPGNPHYGGATFGSPDMVPYGANGYLPYNPNFPPIPGAMGMINHQFFGQPPVRPTGTPSTTSQPDTTKEDMIAKLEQLILDERAEREARDNAREAALAKAAADKLAAEERAAAEKQIAAEAAARATAIAKKEAAEAAAEEAIRAQKFAEEMAANAAAEAKKAAEEAAAAAAAEAKKAAEEAAAAAAEEAKKATEAAAKKAAEEAAAKPPPEKKKPIKFKDAVGRKFSFPFHLCSTWQGMEELIRQAFLHVEVIGPHVAEGHYDLVGPNGDIILPPVWETVVEPDWTVTMHMWPIPEKPKDPDPPPAEAAPAPAAAEPKKKPDAGPKKPKPPRGDPGSFALWMMGNNRPRVAKTLKAEKKPETIQQ